VRANLLREEESVRAIVDRLVQRQITPQIIFENLTAAVRLGEQMLRESETVEEFNEKMRSHRLPADDVKPDWRSQEFGKAKSQLASGEGLGKDFLKQFLGERKRMDNNTVQTVLDTYYAESRKAAAEKRRKEQEKLAAEKAKEHEKQKAEAERKRVEKEAAMEEAQRIEVGRVPESGEGEVSTNWGDLSRGTASHVKRCWRTPNHQGSSVIGRGEDCEYAAWRR
jgi:hypothetical protein